AGYELGVGSLGEDEAGVEEAVGVEALAEFEGLFPAVAGHEVGDSFVEDVEGYLLAVLAGHGGLLNEKGPDLRLKIGAVLRWLVVGGRASRVYMATAPFRLWWAWVVMPVA